MVAVTFQEASGEERTGIVTVRGKATIYTAPQIVAGLKEAFAGANRVVLDTSSLEEADFTFLQIVCSAHQSARHSHKTFGCSDPPPSVLAGCAAEAGMELAG
jgi:anti-anti-sigma regulatory factor